MQSILKVMSRGERHRFLLKGIVICLMLLAAPVCLLHAQFDAHLGRIVGDVQGPDGSVIPDVEIKIENLESGITQQVQSDALGRFQAGRLRPGNYSVTTSSREFAPTRITGIVVNVGSAVSVNLELSLEQLSTEIEVTGAVLDSMLPVTSNVVQSEVFDDLPINGRRFHDFALLTPTVQVAPGAGHLSFGAQRGIYTNVTVDGTDYNQSFFGGIQGGERANFIITVPQSAIQEFQAVTSGFTAEYGRTTSGVINVSTKAGANDVHGDVFYQIRHPSLGIRDPFGAKILEKLQQAGGSIGGPLQRNKSFLFFAVERQASSYPRYVEFPLLDVADRSRGAEAYDWFQSLEESFESTNNAWALTPRFDYQINGANQLMMRYNYSTAQAANGVGFTGVLLPRATTAVSNSGTEEDSIHFLTTQWTSLLSPKLVNQFRFTVTREERPRKPNAETPSVSTTIGSFGTASYLPTTEADMRPLINNSFIMTVGSHNVKFGVEADHVGVEDMFGYHQYGQFILFSSDVNEILDALTPGGQIPNRFDVPGFYLRQLGNTIGSLSLSHAALYAQDSWRVFPELTLDLGFRWEGQFNSQPKLGNEDLVNRVLSHGYPFGTVNPAYIPSDKRQFMPRLGASYSPGWSEDRLVIRGSFGIFHAITPPVFINGATKSFREPAFNISALVPTAYPTVYQQFQAAGIDLNNYALNDLPLLSQEDFTRVLDGDPLQGASPYMLSPEFRNPRAIKFTLAMEQQLTDNIITGVQWMFSSTTRLHGLRDYNLPQPVIRPDDPTAIPYYDLGNRPSPTLGSIYVNESIARARYSGLTFDWKYLGDQVHMVAHYTYARAYSSDINEDNFWDPVHTDQSRPEDAYGPSALDMRNQFTGHIVWNLPGGFKWSSIVRASSAAPLNPLSGTDLNGDGVIYDRALRAPGRFFERNGFRNRGMRNIDMRVLRQFRFSGSTWLEFSAEFFNIFNFHNVQYGGFNVVYGPGLDLSTGQPLDPNPSFQRLRDTDGNYDRNNSQISGTGPFRMQVGVRFHF